MGHKADHVIAEGAADAATSAPDGNLFEHCREPRGTFGGQSTRRYY